MQTLSIPGVSPAILAAAQLEMLDATTALARCGINAAGLFIPYFALDNIPVLDQGGPFGRLRLNVALENGQKYHQRAGTAPHAYLPPGITQKASDAKFIVIIEGEKKALSIADEDGIAAVGIGGFYNFRNKDGTLVPELAALLSIAAPSVHIVFYGDRDVIFNYQFAHAATVLRPLIAPRELYVSCLPITAPGKGIDDCKAQLDAQSFKSLFVQSLITGLPMTPAHTPADLAVSLLRRKLPSDWTCPESMKEEVARDFASLITALRGYALEQDAMIKKAVEVTGFGKALIKRMAKQYRQEHSLISDFGIDRPVKVIDLSVQPGIWTRQILETIGSRTYLYGGNLCTIDGDKFRPHNAASLVAFVDSPDCCSFLKTGSDGEAHPAQLTERETRVVVNALSENKDVLQPVSVFSRLPVLGWTKDGPKLISGYSRETAILAKSAAASLPHPADAAKYLNGILRDFQFATPGDMGRAISMLLTPALAKGGFLDSGRAPFFMVEKDKKGAGGGMLVKSLAAINGERLITITPSDEKDAKEDISKHLLEGASLISFDNIRGKILTKLSFFESLLTEPVFTCRAPYVHGDVEVSHTVFVGTSNGAVLSPDLADRTVVVAIKKQPGGYVFADWESGSLIDYLNKYQVYFLHCVFSLILDWANKGRPAGSAVTGFRYPQWEKACSWILANHFSDLPLLNDGHGQTQERLANPDFDLLRAVFRKALERQSVGPLNATDLLRLAIETGHMPGEDPGDLLRMGRILSNHFQTEGQFKFAGEFTITRRDEKNEKYEKVKKYIVRPCSR